MDAEMSCTDGIISYPFLEQSFPPLSAMLQHKIMYLYLHLVHYKALTKMISMEVANIILRP